MALCSQQTKRYFWHLIMSHFSDICTRITLPSLRFWNQGTYVQLDFFILLYYFYLQLKLYQPFHTLILVQSFRIQCSTMTVVSQKFDNINEIILKAGRKGCKSSIVNRKFTLRFSYCWVGKMWLGTCHS